MKLYKFRAVKDFDKIKEILETGMFHMAEWGDLNDPMEGYFYHYFENNEDYNINLRNLLGHKCELRVCCFSKNIQNILSWARYTNNYKGIAIEITFILQDYQSLFKVDYEKSIPLIIVDNETDPKSLLKKKIKLWKYENEYRYIDKCVKVKIGEISSVYFGLRMTDQDKKEIKSILKDRIPYYNTTVDFEKNKIIVASN